MNSSSERIALASFLACSLIAGCNPVATRFSNRELDPLWGAGTRFSAAAILLLIAMVAMKQPLPRGKRLTGALLFGALTFGGAFSLIYLGLMDVHAGFGSILFALVPLMTIGLAALQREEPLRAMSVAGALVALVGIAVMSRAPLKDSVPVLSVLALLGSAFCFAQGAVVVRLFPPVHPLTMNAVGMSVGAALLLGASLIAGERLELPQRAATWGAVAYGIFIGSILVFLLYLVVLERWTASRASYGFVLSPIVTVLLSAWLDDEPVGFGLLFGGALVLAGVYIGALRPTRGPVTALERVA